MKIIMMILLLGFSGQAAQACSPIPITLIAALNEVDALFEGSVVAAYVNGQQVSTSLLNKELANNPGPFEIMLKVKPERWYFGSEALLPYTPLIEIHTMHSPGGICGSAFTLNPGSQLWAARLYMSSGISPGYHESMTYLVAQLLDLIATYKLALLSTPAPAQSLIATFIDRETNNLTALLAGRKLPKAELFPASTIELTYLPRALLKARLTFMTELGLMTEVVKTRAALSMQP